VPFIIFYGAQLGGAVQVLILLKKAFLLFTSLAAKRNSKLLLGCVVEKLLFISIEIPVVCPATLDILSKRAPGGGLKQEEGCCVIVIFCICIVTLLLEIPPTAFRGAAFGWFKAFITTAGT
jgi:hypothetical protein